MYKRQVENEHAPVLLVGFGRYGQIVARVLLSAGIRPTVIDHDADTVDSARRFGFKVYFGDATQPDLLHAAGLDQARAVVVAVDDVTQTNRLVHELRASHPQLPILARARDAVHAMELEDAGVHHVQRELFESSLRSARATLETLGFDRFHARELADEFRRYTQHFITSARDSRHDEDDFVQRVREAREQFEKQMQADLQRQHRHTPETGWAPGSDPDRAA